MNWILRLTRWILNKWFTGGPIDLYTRMTRRHPKITTIGLGLLYLLIIVILFKITYTILKYNCLFNPVAEIEHIDMAGQLCAILSIIIAFLITIYVEENHDKQTESLQDGSRSIKESTDKIGDVTKQVWEILAYLTPKKSLSERLDEIDKIIDITSRSQQNSDPDSQNELYILHYNASYGNLQSYNASVTLGDESYNHDRPCSWIQYHEIFTHFNKRQTASFQKLLQLKKASINIALLRTKISNFKNQEDKFEKLLRTVLIENKEQKVYSYFKSDLCDCDILKNSDGTGYIYAVPLSQREHQKFDGFSDEDERQSKIKDKLILELCNSNKEKIEALYDAEVVNKIAYLDYVPFEFYITTPRNRNKSFNERCLVLFTNLLHPTHTVSFVSENEVLIDTLKDIHSTLTGDYGDKEGKKQMLMELFSCVDTEPIFVLTKVHDKKNIRNEKTDLAYLSDYAAYTDLKALFSDYQIINKLQFNDQLSVNKIKNQNKTFVVIGLFGNHLAEQLRFVPGKNNSCFTFNRCKEKRRKGGPIEYIHERIGIQDMENGMSTNENQGNLFRRNEQTELALLAKIKVGKSTVIICGGLTGYGTGIIGRYVSQNISKITEVVKKGNLNSESFAIVFTMPLYGKKENEYDSKVIDGITMKGIFTQAPRL